MLLLSRTPLGRMALTTLRPRACSRRSRSSNQLRRVGGLAVDLTSLKSLEGMNRRKYWSRLPSLSIFSRPLGAALSLEGRIIMRKITLTALLLAAPFSILTVVAAAKPTAPPPPPPQGLKGYPLPKFHNDVVTGLMDGILSVLLR